MFEPLLHLSTPSNCYIPKSKERCKNEVKIENKFEFMPDIEDINKALLVRRKYILKNKQAIIDDEQQKF
jgi:hypothetical protein